MWSRKMRNDAHHVAIYTDIWKQAVEFANMNCATTFNGTDNCNWYHAAWPLLRLLNVVSTPYWHYDFYQFALRNAVGPKQSVDIAVIGAADFAMASIASETLKNININISVIDQCKTALHFNNIWANRNNIKITPLQLSVFNVEELEASYDIVISDAFLTRFPASSKSDVIFRIASTLKPGGKFITTVRDYSWETHRSENIASLTRNGLNELALNQMFSLSFSNDDISLALSIAKQYAKNINSFPFSDNDQIEKCCRANKMTVEYKESALTSGEFDATPYCRLILKKQPY